MLDRMTFRRFLKFPDKLPGAEEERAFLERFHQVFSEQGVIGKVGQIIDATVVQAPVQRYSREENAQIKQGQRPDSFDARPSRGRQKDTDARWTKKHGRYCYGYKSHAKGGPSAKLLADSLGAPFTS